MRFSQPLVLLAAAGGVSAQSTVCEAQPIVERCLSTENLKISSCQPTDYDCLCSAYEAVATCYNNCPKDPRGFAARQQVTVFCSNASIHGTGAQAARTSATNVVNAASSATATASSSISDSSSSTPGGSSTSASASASSPAKSGAAEPLAAGANGALMDVAGLLAVLA